MNDIQTYLAKEIDRELCNRSMFEFFKQAWHVIEPTTELKDNWHHKYICDLLQAEAERIIEGIPKTDGDIIINVPFRSTKSIICTVLFPVWCWIKDPTLRLITASYSGALSVEHAVKSRDVIESPWFKELWGDIFVMKSDQNVKSKYENDKTGSRRATSVGGTLTGQGGNINIVDDPLNPLEATSEIARSKANYWYDNTFYSRLNDPEVDVRIVIMQRLHEKDLTGHLLKNGKYRHICIPAEKASHIQPRELADNYVDNLFWPGRFSKKILDDYKSVLGSYGYAGQMQQLPAPAEGGIIKKAWFQKIAFSDFVALKKEGDPTPVWDFYLDTAYTKNTENDPTALLACTYYKENLYIKRVKQAWLEFPELMKETQSFALSNGYTGNSRIYVEPAASGKSLVQQLRNGTGLNVIEYKPPDKDKVTRANTATPFMEAMRLFIIEDDWNESLIHECVSFPNGEHDDQVDVLVMAINKYANRKASLLAFG